METERKKLRKIDESINSLVGDRNTVIIYAFYFLALVFTF